MAVQEHSQDRQEQEVIHVQRSKSLGNACEVGPAPGVELGVEHADALAFAQRSVDDADQHDDAPVGIEPGIKNQRFKGLFVIALRRREAVDLSYLGVCAAIVEEEGRLEPSVPRCPAALVS